MNSKPKSIIFYKNEFIFECLIIGISLFLTCISLLLFGFFNKLNAIYSYIIILFVFFVPYILLFFPQIILKQQILFNSDSIKIKIGKSETQIPIKNATLNFKEYETMTDGIIEFLLFWINFKEFMLINICFDNVCVHVNYRITLKQFRKLKILYGDKIKIIN